MTLAASLLATGLLSGCGATTYGTGVDPGTQTMRDIANIIRLGNVNDDQEAVVIRPRAGIVEPPNKELAPPGSPSASQTAANWPTDPEEIRRRMKAEADEARASGSRLAYDPGIRIEDQPGAPDSEDCQGNPTCMYRRVAAAKDTLKPNTTNRAGSVDATGAPTRKYLVEPPSVYRQPSPDAPVVVSEQTKDERVGGGLLRRLWPF